MKRVLAIIISITIILSSFTFVGCKKSDHGEKKVLRISNCEDYISTGDESGEYVDLLAKFTEETGIEVEYSTYSTNENLYNELVINPKSYDIVIPSEYMIQKLATEGRLKKLDTTKIPNYANVSPFIKKRLESISFEVIDGDYEGEQANLAEFAVGYMWGTMGWVYNTDKVSIDDVKTWNSVFASGKHNQRATLKDSVRDSYLVGLGMVYEDELKQVIASGDNVNERVNAIFNRIDEESIDKVGNKLASLKSSLYGFEVDSGKNDIVTGKIDAYVAWSGDAAYAIDEAADDGVSLDYYVPDCGSNIWFDGMVVPAESDNDDAIYKFINFICDQENAVHNMEYIGYSSVVAGDTVFEYVKENFDEEDGTKEVKLGYFFSDDINDANYVINVSEESYGRLMAQYPEFNIVERCAVMSYFDPDTTISINNMWERVKGETFPIGLIIGATVLVVLIAAAIVLYRNKDSLKIKIPEFRRKTLADKGYKVVNKEEL